MFAVLIWRLLRWRMRLLRPESHGRVADKCRELPQDPYGNVQVLQNNICLNAPIEVGVPPQLEAAVAWKTIPDVHPWFAKEEPPELSMPLAV